jgi:hypothetical protein
MREWVDTLHVSALRTYSGDNNISKRRIKCADLANNAQKDGKDRDNPVNMVKVILPDLSRDYDDITCSVLCKRTEDVRFSCIEV